MFTLFNPGMPEPLLAGLHRQIEAESAEALRRLKAVLEEGPVLS